MSPDFANGAITAAFSYAAATCAAGGCEEPNYNKNSSPTSESISNPRSVDFITKVGPWGDVHFIGEATGVAQAEADLLALGNTESMASVLAAVQASGRMLTIRVDLANINNGWNYVVTIDEADPVYIQTTEGSQPAADIIKLGHELPYAVFNTTDTGPGQMSNINQYENPLRQELGYPLRTQY